MEFHPITEIFPLMQGEPYDELVKDIREHGLHESIWLHPDERIIDGRNRHRACLDAGIEPRFRTWDGEGSLVQFVVSLNLHRRHLTSSQRAASAAEALEQLTAEAKERQREGGKTKVRQKFAEAPDAGRATEQAAKMFGTNRTYVTEAAKLRDEDPEQFENVKHGNVGLAAIMERVRKAEETSAAPRETGGSIQPAWNLDAINREWGKLDKAHKDRFLSEKLRTHGHPNYSGQKIIDVTT